MTTRIRSCAPPPSRRSPASITRTNGSAHHDSSNGEGGGPADELPDIERRAKAIGKGSPLSLRERALVEGIADGVKDHIKALEVRIDELQKTQLRFCGRWTEGEYEPNSIVELGGSAWVAKG